MNNNRYESKSMTGNEGQQLARLAKRVALSLCRKYPDVALEDMIQTCALALLEFDLRPARRKEDCGDNYYFQVAANAVCLEFGRKASRRRRLESELHQLHHPRVEISDAGVLWRQIKAGLSAEDEEFLALAVFCDLTAVEVGQLLGLKKSTAARRLTRAVKAAQQALGIEAAAKNDGNCRACGPWAESLGYVVRLRRADGKAKKKWFKLRADALRCLKAQENV